MFVMLYSVVLILSDAKEHRWCKDKRVHGEHMTW